MQGLTYFEDGKEQYARFYAHWDRRLQEVVMDVLHASASVLLRPECSGDHSSIF